MVDAVALLLPGMALNTTIFPELACPTIAPDFSGGPGAPGEGMSAYVAALDRCTDTPVWQNAHRRFVIGHSFGGMLALQWLLAPDSSGRPPVHGLILASTTAGPMYAVANIRVGPLRIPAKPLIRMWNNQTVSRAAKRMLGGGRTTAVNFREFRARAELAIGIAGWRQTTVEGRRAYRSAMMGFDVRSRLGEIPVPAIVLHGTRDTYFRTPLAEALAAGLPRGTLRMVPGARHVLPITHPEAVLQAFADLNVDH